MCWIRHTLVMKCVHALFPRCVHLCGKAHCGQRKGGGGSSVLSDSAPSMVLEYFHHISITMNLPMCDSSRALWSSRTIHCHGSSSRPSLRIPRFTCTSKVRSNQKKRCWQSVSRGPLKGNQLNTSKIRLRKFSELHAVKGAPSQLCRETMQSSGITGRVQGAEFYRCHRD